MSKIWIFVEGDSEENYISYLLKRIYSEKIYLCKDYAEFVSTDITDYDFSIVIIENCHSIDKIPYRINEIDYHILRSGTDKIIIIADLEDLPCYNQRKKLIFNKLKDSVPTTNMRTVFLKPRIEAHYWDCPGLISKIIQLEYKIKYPSSDPPEIVIPPTIKKDISGLKELFKFYSLKYRESRFSQMYFPRVNFDCKNSILDRTRNIIDRFISF